MKQEFLFCVGGIKLEQYPLAAGGPESLVRGMVCLWRGETAGGDIVVYRPALGGPVRAERSEFIPLDEVPDFFDDE